MHFPRIFRHAYTDAAHCCANTMPDIQREGFRGLQEMIGVSARAAVLLAALAALLKLAAFS